MRKRLFWLSDDQWAKIGTYLPQDVLGKARVDDHRVFISIPHVLRSGGRWCNCPPEYSQPTTIFNRFVRPATHGVWETFLNDSRVCLSNNAAGRAPRGIALGRKSWLFCGSDRGGQWAAAMYSLIVTALCRAANYAECRWQSTTS